MDGADLTRTAFPADFSQAAAPAERRVTVPLTLDTDVLAYFQSDSEPGDWQRHINGILRFYMDTNQIMQAEAEATARMEQAVAPEHQP